MFFFLQAPILAKMLVEEEREGKEVHKEIEQQRAEEEHKVVGVVEMKGRRQMEEVAGCVGEAEE